MAVICRLLVVFVILALNTRRWLLALVCKTWVLAPDMTRKGHDLAHGMIVIVRLWLAYNVPYPMYGMCYFGELTKFCAYGLWFDILKYLQFQKEGPILIA